MQQEGSWKDQQTGKTSRGQRAPPGATLGLRQQLRVWSLGFHHLSSRLE